jgi:Mannosylglycerate hydrolase MGH1-like glycoside hydrolase domain
MRPTNRHPSSPGPKRSDLIARARHVLEANWRGGFTVPSASLYPHQWSWDSAFISIGRSWFDEARARLELSTLFHAQWVNGKVPHIVFNPAVPKGSYFPGPEFWRSETAADAPSGLATSGITQPPIHARAALEMHRHATDRDASEAWLRDLYPRLAAQHAYLDRRRDAGGIGLPAIVHPWESGLDNSPIWDMILAGLDIPVGAVPPYRRFDLAKADPDDRPTDDAYDAFVFLALRYREAGYDDARLMAATPFIVAGPLFVAIHLWSTHALAEIAAIVGADPRPHREAAVRIHEAMLRHLWDPASARFLPRNLVSGALEPEETIVSFAPLLDPDLPAEHVEAIVAGLESACFHPASGQHYVVPTYSVRAPDFDRRRYWRGPVWLNTNWLLAAGLRQHGRDDLAREIVNSSLELVTTAGFHEYFDPFDGTGRGSSDFGWSAALAVDFLEQTPAG